MHFEHVEIKALTNWFAKPSFWATENFDSYEYSSCLCCCLNDHLWAVCLSVKHLQIVGT